MATYTVKKGDTLSEIAQKYGTTYQEIAKANGISNPNLIRAGQVLNIGGSESPTQKKSATTPTQTTTPTTKQWSYNDFKPSDSTTTADQKRQDVSSQKPGDFSYGAYEKSDVVKQAEALLQQQLANNPGSYQSQWQTQLDDTMNKILNREKFSYDLNGDALYQQYKDQFTTQGKLASMDTMGQAQAMTGGYGNSYAQSVGQQAYQGYLQKLNEVVPELYQLALNQYNREGDDLYNQYGLYADREDQDYGRYRDTVSDYNAELDRLTNDARYQSETDYNRFMDQYNMAYGQHRDQVSDWQTELNRADSDYWNQYERDYGQYSDDRNMSYDNFWNQQNMAYQQERDQKSDEQWQAEFDEAKRQYDQQYELAAAKTGSSGSNSSYDDGYVGSQGDTGDEIDDDEYAGNEGLSEEKIKMIQRSLGVTADGKWGSESKKAAGGLGAKAAYDAWNKGKLEGAQRVNEGKIKTFMKNIHSEDMHDAVMRHKWGSYRQYVAYQIEHSDLSDVEKAYLISYYGIQESDTNYK